MRTQIRDRLSGAARGLVEHLPAPLWALTLLTLPITSLPLLVHLSGGGIVTPAAALPLGGLLALWYLPYLAMRRRLPFEASPLLGFAVSAALAGLFALFLEIHPFKGETAVSRQAAAWLTLGLGMAFYLITASYVSAKPGRMRITLAWILAGLALALVWSGVQAYYVLCCEGEFPYRIRELHRLLSIRDLSSQRVTGLAYEPSWFAHQLNMLYFPLCLASLVTGVSAFPRRVAGVPVEWLLLGASVIALGLSTSRVGILGFGSMAGLAVAWLAIRFTRRVNSSLRQRLATRARSVDRFAGLLSSVLVWLGFLLALGLVAVGLVLVAARLDWRWERILAPPGIRLFSLEYANYMLFSERAVYWSSAFRVFERFPVLGVGLGNAGFFIPETMPAFAWALPEVVEVLDPGSGLFPNPKSLWIRLLAETGVVGTSFYVAWLILMAAIAVRLVRRGGQVERMMGALGLFSLVAAVAEGFSVDSFAFPYFWVAMGLVTAANRKPKLRVDESV